ncbi:MAG: hypothetical protein KBF42_09245 [Chitinophagales bacterium]|nr:hypothetical protein [Bacteroidota bacterium]MBP9221559.1 hypothetical protein [Chitinophagales bacterium]
MFFITLLFIFILAPISILLALIWLFSGKKLFGKILGGFWLLIFLLIVTGRIIDYFTTPINLEREDIYGEYVIDRNKYPGFQADWQYDHFRFEITKNDSIYFYVTEGKAIVKTYSGTISFHHAYKRPRLIININAPRHHIIEDNPTLFRVPRDFYYVFNSSKFGNVFFTKGRWKEITN